MLCREMVNEMGQARRLTTCRLYDMIVEPRAQSCRDISPRRKLFGGYHNLSTVSLVLRALLGKLQSLSALSEAAKQAFSRAHRVGRVLSAAWATPPPVLNKGPIESGSKTGDCAGKHRRLPQVTRSRAGWALLPRWTCPHQDLLY